MQRGYSTHDNSDIVAAVVPADGSGTGLESGHFAGSPLFAWAPDDTSILVLPTPEQAQLFRQLLILDPLTGATRQPPWPAERGLTWQRVAR